VDTKWNRTERRTALIAACPLDPALADCQAAATMMLDRFMRDDRILPLAD
jgi:hypothetical protein